VSKSAQSAGRHCNDVRPDQRQFGLYRSGGGLNDALLGVFGARSELNDDVDHSLWIDVIEIQSYFGRSTIADDGDKQKTKA
jgi:hypothetical protein